MVDVPSWAIGVGIIILATSLGRSLRGLGRTRTPSRAGLETDISGMREALDDVQRRLGEIEERLDFAERLLAKPRDADRGVPPPK
jgi:hypothetical protein